LTALIGNLLLPPLDLLLMAGCGYILVGSGYKKFGRILIGFSFIALWGLSMPLTGNYLLQSLAPTPLQLNGAEADAIVILAGGSVHQAAEYDDHDSLNWLSLERVRYGALLAHKLHKPVLVTGGDPFNYGTSEAKIMASTLEQEYGVRVQWMEEHSRTTHENAEFSAPILKKNGIKRIYLVSHAWHLARAIPEFERLGLIVIPAGTGYGSREFRFLSLLPSASGLQNSYFACHEALGLAWYWVQNKLMTAW
jgi:uncharacterized SAM-binding protein YcdF (DUF218 family)